MRVFKTSYRDRHQQAQKSSKWYVEFRDQNEILRRLPAFTSKSASEEFARNMEKLVAYHRATGGQVDPALQNWLSGLPRQTHRKLAEIHLIESPRTAAGIPLEQHLRDFTASLKAKGNTVRHIDLVTGRIRAVLNGCGFRYWSDITSIKAQKYLAGLREGENGISPQTFNFYLQAIKQFCRWMVREKRAVESPLTYLGSLNVRTDRRHDRRALTTDEMIFLLDAAESGPVRFGATGRERALIYRMAVETGLRAGEIRSLTASSFSLEGDTPTVTVEAAYSKNRRECVLP